MFPPWRFHLKSAQQALDEGRVEDALTLINRERLTDYAPGQQLRLTAGKTYAKRAIQRAVAGDLDGGWLDLQHSHQVLGDASEWTRAVSAVLLAEEEALARHWQAGNFRLAAERIATLARQPAVMPAQFESLNEISRRLESAHKLAMRGKFLEADEQYGAAAALRKDLPILAELRTKNKQNQDAARQLEEQLHRALAAQEWPTALRLADEILAIAPQCHLARDARRRAWGEVGASLGDTQAHAPRPSPEDEREQPQSPRFLLWIDAVGGFLVCLGNEIVLGQAQPHGEADVPLQADISRRHALMVRDADGYLIEPLARTVLNGTELEQKSLLKDGDILEIGAVKLRFRKPHPLSTSARLEFVSRHRTHPFSDGVILMGESCVLGPKRQSHILCRSWRSEVILNRQQDELFCRGSEALEIDGKLLEGRGPVGWDSTIAGSDFSMKLEWI